MGEGFEGHSDVMWCLVMKVGLVWAKCGLERVFEFCVL